VVLVSVKTVSDYKCVVVLPVEEAEKAAQLCAEQSRSITTFRFVPTDLALGDNKTVSYLDQLNLELLTRLQASGETYLSMRWSMENSPCTPAL
jgi:hypothetical protein